jgi:hypothetical protein
MVDPEGSPMADRRSRCLPSRNVSRRLAHHARKGDARRPCIARDQRRAFRLRRGAPWSKRPDVSGNARACTLLRVSAGVIGAGGGCTIRPDADPVQHRVAPYVRPL